MRLRTLYVLMIQRKVGNGAFRKLQAVECC